ncbi:MAG: dephospho-CoA kinase [Synergistaceae bacterium]|jgi:dephospho-CoA kinase|nr:dephospho-CoA kinase [Synergistaceae bacterium]
MFTVAVTGESGAGKSTLTRIWGDLGANVFDLDALAKKQWSRPETAEKVIGRWGAGMYKNGSPDTPDFKKISDMVFSSDENYSFATGVTHPGAIAGITKEVHNLGGWIVMEIPLLFEVGWFDLIDCVICVTSTADLRIERNAARGWDEEEIARRERFLIGSHKKQTMSDMVLCNIGSMEAWEARARELGDLMRRMATVQEIGTFCNSREEAGRIAGLLVENRLAAAVNIMEAGCVYRWKERVSEGTEWHLRCLTIERNLRRAMETIRQNHSYEQPLVTGREVLRSDFLTLKWVVESCS